MDYNSYIVAPCLKSLLSKPLSYLLPFGAGTSSHHFFIASFLDRKNGFFHPPLFDKLKIDLQKMKRMESRFNNEYSKDIHNRFRGISYMELTHL